MLPSTRPPSRPGEILAAEFLEPLGVTQTQLSERMGVPIQRINLLINGKRGVTAETALLLAQVFDTSPEFWMHLQANYDLWLAAAELKRAGRQARPLTKPSPRRSPATSPRNDR